VPLVKRDAARQLNVEVPQAKRAARSLADCGEGLWQKIVQGSPVSEFLSQALTCCVKSAVTQRVKIGFEVVDPVDNGTELLQLFLVGIEETTECLAYE
jgi:hypothetical protein